MAIRNITNNYSDKCTITPSSINTSTPPTVIVITTNNGYKFSDLYDNGLSSPMVNFNSRDGDFTTNDPSLFSVTLSADKKTLTFTPNSDGLNYLSGCSGGEIIVNSNHPILIDDTPTYPIVTLTKHLTNVTISPDVSSIELDGTSKVITLTSNQGYEFSGTPYFEWNREPYYFEQSGSSYIYDLNTLINENASIDIYATATINTRTKNVINSLINCTITPEFNSMIEGVSYNLTLNANKGFKFVTTPTLSINNRDMIILDFTKVTDYQYTLSFTAESSYYDILDDCVLSGVAVEETPIVNKYGAIQVYKPSNSDMASLATKRFRANNTVDGVTFADIDLGSYITQFKRIFFDVATSSKSNILLGVHDTQINTDVVNNDDVTIDCGTVILEGANGNELDTKIYKIKIVLPFYEVVELPSIYMNKTIHIVYQANVITGYADILINEVVDNTDLLIVKYRCKVSQDLPYILDYDKLNGALSDMQLNTSPKIILQKNNTFIDKGYTTYKEGLISNEVGYFEVKDIVSMSVNATQKEKDLIENLLKSGVYL